MHKLTCCEQGARHLERRVFGVGREGWTFRFQSVLSGHWRDEYGIEFHHCPFCGKELSKGEGDGSSLDIFLSTLPANPLRERRITFDVDGVLCEDRNQPIDYEDRKPYPWVADALKKLKAAGYLIVVQTARGMQKYDGDWNKAYDRGVHVLQRWLREHDIPYDEVYFGKASSHVYFDDRGCRVQGNLGSTEWEKSVVAGLKQIEG